MNRQCADCGTEIGKDAGPKDGWQLEDGRTVCHACAAVDLKKFAELKKFLLPPLTQSDL